MKPNTPHFKNPLNDPYARDEFPSDLGRMLMAFFEGAFLIAFFAMVGRAVLTPPGLPGLIAELLARVAILTGNNNLAELMTGLYISVLILAFVGIQLFSVFSERKDSQFDSIDTNVFELGERLELLGQEVDILKHRLVIEPAMQALEGHEGIIDRETGQILHVGPIDDDMMQAYTQDYDQVQAYTNHETCPICQSTYLLRPCPQCGNEIVPDQVDPNCILCHGTGIYGICKENHYEDEREAFRRGRIAYWGFTTLRNIYRKLHINWLHPPGGSAHR